MSRETHAKQRAAMIGASNASTIMRGGPKAWDTLIKRLWLDDGSDFAKVVGGARGYGHAHEAEGAAKFWERHPEYELQEVEWLDALPDLGDDIAPWTGCSPDRLIVDAITGVAIGGLEIKSPVEIENFSKHTGDAHIDQIQHSMLVTGGKEWWRVVHLGEAYDEARFEPDDGWRTEYLPKLKAFIRQYETGVKQRRRISLADLQDL